MKKKLKLSQQQFINKKMFTQKDLIQIFHHQPILLDLILILVLVNTLQHSMEANTHLKHKWVFHHQLEWFHKVNTLLDNKLLFSRCLTQIKSINQVDINHKDMILFTAKVMDKTISKILKISIFYRPTILDYNNNNIENNYWNNIFI